MSTTNLEKLRAKIIEELKNHINFGTESKILKGIMAIDLTKFADPTAEDAMAARIFEATVIATPNDHQYLADNAKLAAKIFYAKAEPIAVDAPAKIA